MELTLSNCRLTHTVQFCFIASIHNAFVFYINVESNQNRRISCLSGVFAVPIFPTYITEIWQGFLRREVPYSTPSVALSDHEPFALQQALPKPRKMRKYAFGSSTPRQLSHQKVREKSNVLEALGNDANNDIHDVRTFVKNIHNPSPRSKSLPKSQKTFVFGSSTPREWSHMVKVAPLHRVYDAKLPRKERSQTVSSLRNVHSGSVKSLQFEAKRVQITQPATSREARPRTQRVNLPPAPNTKSQRKQASAEDEEEPDNDAASEPDIKMDRARKDWSARENAKPAKQVAMKTDKKPNKEPKIIPTNHITETDSELIFERSEDIVPADSVNKKVIPSYNDEDDGVVNNRPVVRRASDREMHSLIEDLEITNPVQVDLAQSVIVDNQKNEAPTADQPAQSNNQAEANNT